MKKTLHFLSGIPRSGSSVLAAILNQNPSAHVSTTSGLVFALDGLANTWHSTGLLGKNDPTRTKLAATMRGVIDAFYEDTDKPIIIDKSRGWPIATIIESMTQVLNRQPKIIATVRSIPDCAASFVRVAKPTNLDEFMSNGQLMTHLKAAYISLHDGYEFAPENFLFVEYEDLLKEPKIQLARIHEFLDLPEFKYDFFNIDGSTVAEDDENLHGYVGMHNIKPVLAPQHKQDSRELLKHYYSEFLQPEFWLKPSR
jgi:sulfotransferase